MFLRLISLLLASVVAGSVLAAPTDPFALDRLRALLAKQVQVLAEREKDPVLGQVTSPDGIKVNVYAVGLPAIVSEPGQSLEMFLIERGDPMRQRTRQTQWEVCARICRAPDGRYALKPVTLRASLSCATPTWGCPDGFSDTGQSVHTHGEGPVVAPTSVDRLLEPGVGLVHVSPNHLSETDKRVPGTWLLAPNGHLVNIDGPVFDNSYFSVDFNRLLSSPWIQRQDDQAGGSIR